MNIPMDCYFPRIHAVESSKHGVLYQILHAGDFFVKQSFLNHALHQSGRDKATLGT